MSLIGDQEARTTASQSGASDDTFESVNDYIVVLGPTLIPYYSMLKTGPAPGNIEHEWMMDYWGRTPESIGEISWAGEGADASPVKAANRPRMFNRTGILRKAYSVTGTQAVVKNIGIDEEFEYQGVKNAQRMLVEAEWAAINSTLNSDSQLSSGPNIDSVAGQFRRFGGLINFITSLTSFVRSGVTFPTGAYPVDYDAKANTPSLANEDDVTEIIRQMAARGGIVDGMVHGWMETTAKAFFSRIYAPPPTSSSVPGVYRRLYEESAPLEITLPVDIVNAEFATIHAHVCLVVPVATILFTNPDFIELNLLRDVEFSELAKTGDSKKGMVQMEATLSYLAPPTIGRLTNWATGS